MVAILEELLRRHCNETGGTRAACLKGKMERLLSFSRPWMELESVLIHRGKGPWHLICGLEGRLALYHWPPFPIAR